MNAQNTPCDRTTHNQSRPCQADKATWMVKRPSDRSYVYAACPLHLSQVSTRVLAGERGELNVLRIRTVEL